MNFLNRKSFIITYLAGYGVSFLAITALFALYVSIFSKDESGAGLGLVIALPLMFVITSIAYFWVPASPLVSVVLLRQSIFKERGSRSKSTLISVGLAIATWLVTYPLAVALINLVYASNDFMKVQESSAGFIIMQAVANLMGLIFSVLWVQLRRKHN